MPIDISKYVGVGGTPQFFNNSGPAILEDNNIFGGFNIFIEPVIVPQAQANDQAVNLGQVSDIITTTLTDTVTVTYLNQQLALYAPLAGATFTGPVILSADPTQPMQAATMHYVQQQTVNGVQVNQSNTFEAGFTQTFLGPVVVQNATANGNPVTLGQFNTEVALLAPLASPNFTGTATVPNLANAADNSTNVPNTAWVNTFVANNAFNVNVAHTWGSTQTFTNPPSITTPASNPTANQLITFSQVQGLITTATAGMIIASSNVTWTGTHTFDTATSFVAGLTSQADITLTAANKLHFGNGSYFQSSDTAGVQMVEGEAAPGGQLTIKDSNGVIWTNIDTRGGTFANKISGPDGSAANDYATVGQVGATITAQLANYAPLASPIFTGTPQGPTPSGTNNQQLATVGYVNSKTGGQFDPTANYTLTGIWTFNNPVVVPNATANTQAVNLGQMNSALSGYATTSQLSNYLPLTGGGLSGGLVVAGNVTLSGGSSTFVGQITVPNATNGITFAATGSGNSGGFIGISNTNIMSVTLPTGQSAMPVFNSSGTNLGNIVTNPMTATGDLIVGGTSGTPTRVGIGTSGQVLTVSAGGAPVWSNAPSSPYVVTKISGGNVPTASSANSVAIGPNVTTTKNLTLGISVDTTTNLNISAATNIGIGFNMTLDQASSIVIGSGPATMGTGAYNISIGYNNTLGSTSTGGVVIVGSSSSAISQGTAVGNATNATGTNSVALGTGAKATNTNAIAIGNTANVSGVSSIAVGAGITCAVNSATVVGNGASATTNGNATVIGSGASAASGSVVVGNFASSASTADVSIGNSAIASGSQAIAMGSTSNATGAQVMAIGYGAVANANSALAVGNAATASAVNSVVIGNSASALGGGFSVALGTGAAAPNSSAVAVGNGAATSGDTSVAVGAATNVVLNAVALGYNANAQGTNSVALGQGSTTTSAQTNCVSLGAPGATRSIINMANGVNPTDGATIQNCGSLVVNSKSAAYTLALTDTHGIIITSSSPTITIPTNANVAFPVNTVIWVACTSGTTTIAAQSGVTLTGTTSIASNTKVMLIQTAANTWLAI